AYRFNDDGEPGGTAGKPILQAIQGQGLDQVAVPVVRWFGGIKLGTGGLVRAYGGTAAQCLRAAPKTELLDLATCFCVCAFSDMALVRSRLDGFGATIEDEQFDGQGVTWQLALPVDHYRAFALEFANLTRGQGTLEKKPPA
ncbi:MAG: YigZ family protein, partial [Pusillimonas sp.]